MDQQLKIPAREARFVGKDSYNINYKAWAPAGAARAVVLIVPGFNSHSGYFTWVGEQFAANGLAAYAVDQRGRGKSDGERFYVDSFADYISDVEGMAAIARHENPGLQTFILGHSAGGVIACGYTYLHQKDLAGLICESFAFQVPAPDFALAALRGLSHLAPHAHVLMLNNKDFSRDPKVVEQMNNDPLSAHETQPTKTVAEMARADDRLKQQFPEFMLPLFIMHGTEDKATRPSGSQFFFDTAGSADKTLKLYQGHFHDLLNDIGKEEVMDDILAWLGARLK